VPNVRLFRDTSNLSATPELWPAIQKALNDSEFLLLLASRQSAEAKWVAQEIEYWPQQQGHGSVVARAGGWRDIICSGGMALGRDCGCTICQTNTKRASFVRAFTERTRASASRAYELAERTQAYHFRHLAKRTQWAEARAQSG
jgi:hypothetical protein